MSVYVEARTNRSFLEGLDFTHFWINHSENFVDPIFNFINTNKIERLWRSLRAHVSHIRRSVPEESIEGFLDTFMLQCTTGDDNFYDIMLHIICLISQEENVN